jgi:hypothetical protein
MKPRIWLLVPLLIVVAAIAACSSYPRLTDAERLALYRDHAGEPVRSFQLVGSRLNGWTSLGDTALAVWTRPNQAYLLELMGPCLDLGTAQAISISNMTSQVSARFDSVTVIGGLPSIGRIPCRIGSIRPLDVKAVRQAEQARRDAQMVEREGGAQNDSGT